MGHPISALAKWCLKAPVHAYRWTLKPLIGWPCRHLPTCSEYALEAIDINGAWRGGWLTLARLTRCRPGGSHGFDPVPDISGERHRFTPWRYGRWHGTEQTNSVTQAGSIPLDDDTPPRSG